MRGSLKATQRKVTEMRQELVNVDNLEFKNSGCHARQKKGHKANHLWGTGSSSSSRAQHTVGKLNLEESRWCLGTEITFQGILGMRLRCPAPRVELVVFVEIIMDGLGEWADVSAGAPKTISIFTPARATGSAFCPGKEEKKQKITCI